MNIIITDIRINQIPASTYSAPTEEYVTGTTEVRFKVVTGAGVINGDIEIEELTDDMSINDIGKIIERRLREAGS